MTDETQTSRENPLGMKSLTEAMTKSPTEVYGDLLKKAFTYDSVFEGWEKLVVVGLFLWAVWSLGSWIWGLF